MSPKTIISLICFVCTIFSTGLGDAAETVKIAVIGAKTGSASITNIVQFQAVRFAVEELNQKGGLLGKPVELIEFDNKSTAIDSNVAAKQAVKAGVIAVIGPSQSSHALGAAPVLQAAKIPMIATVATNPKVTLVGDYIFRVCFIDPFQGWVMASFAVQDLKAKTAVVLTNTGNKYSIGLAEFFIKNFRRLGGDALWEGDYLEKVTDFAQLVDKVKTLQPEIVFLPGYVQDSALIIKQAKKSGVDATFLGGDGWSDIMYNYASSELNGNYYSTHWHKDVSNKLNRSFVMRYQKRYGEISDVGIPLAYDAVMLLSDAIQRANSLNPSHIRKALSETKNFPGLTGAIKFNPNGNPIKPVVILKFDKGSSIYVKTFEPEKTQQP